VRAKILAVDDEPDQLELMGLLLRDEGFEVATSLNGLEGLDEVGRFRPDLILVDASMPKMNGFSFCEAIRKNAATAGIPIIMITGLHTHFAKLNGLAHGANVFLFKPFIAGELMAKIKELLRAAGPARSPAQ
jgi:DNA-binding response OmpR family regulator